MRPFRPWVLALAAAAGLACSGLPPWLAPTREPEPDPEREWLRRLLPEPASDLPAPEGLAASPGQFRQIPVRWEPVLIPLVAGYLVESADTPEGPFEPRVALPHRGALAWLDRRDARFPLGDSHTRYYRVRAFDHDLRLSAAVTPTVSATTAEPVAPPEDLRAYSLQPRSIPLAWTPAPSPVVSGYVVERSPDVEGPFEVVATLTGRHQTHYLDEGLGDLAVLFYRVASLDPRGNPGPPSGVLRAVTKPPPLPPVDLRVDSQALGTQSLAWEPNVEVDLHSYRLLRWRGDEAAEEVVRVDADRTGAVDPAVGAGELLRYAVVAVDQDGLESLVSEPLEVESLGYEWVARASSGGVRLVWNARESEGFRGTRVTRTGWLSGWTRELGPGEQLVDDDVVPGRSYRYQIQLLHETGAPAPASRPVEIEIPEVGMPFVEIRAPAPRLARPEGIPR